jgi:superfamily II DNA or RNA helicase
MKLKKLIIYLQNQLNYKMIPYKTSCENRLYDLVRNRNISQLNNYELSKPFEFYTSIKLSEEYKTDFMLYDDIEPEFKEENQLSYSDTGIDLCNLVDSIVQCKLYKGTINWKDVSTFAGSQNNVDEEGHTYVKWKKLILSRNSDSSLSSNIRKQIFLDKTFDRSVMCNYLVDLQKNPPTIDIEYSNEYEQRDYQIEVDKLMDENKNCVVCIPTGTGKDRTMINFLKKSNKYFILVPRRCLSEQLEDEIKRFRPDLSDDILVIGDGKKCPKKIMKNIVICVYNSYGLYHKQLENFIKQTHKIFIDEAHNVYRPQIYKEAELEYDDNFSCESEDEESEDDESETEDDETESDESEDIISLTFIKRIRKLKKYNKIVYLSATIDELPNCNFYKKDIREMIEKGYICDYTIHIPIFTQNNDKTVCNYLVQNYTNIIIYTANTKEGKKINKMLNQFEKNCSCYIDYNTNAKDRKKILKKFENGEIKFIVNVRVLKEGFNCSKVMGVCFMKFPTDRVSLIQMIGRALRKHHLKKFAKIIIPFSNKDDKTISKFLKILSDSDPILKKSLLKGENSGRIIVKKANIEEKNDDEEKKENEEKDDEIYNILYESVYKSIGEAIFDSWLNKYNNLDEYLSKLEKKKWPPRTIKDPDINCLGSWIHRQKTSFKKNKLSNERKEKLKELAKKHNLSLEIKENISWEHQFELLVKYVDENKKWPPFSKQKNPDIKSMGWWVHTQKTSIKNNKLSNERKKKLEELAKKHNLSLEIKENISWEYQFELIVKYVDENKKWPPSSKQEDPDIKSMGKWVYTQKQSIKKNKLSNERKEKLEELSKKHNLSLEIKEFGNKGVSWEHQFELLVKYVNEKKKWPPRTIKDPDINCLGSWIHRQKTSIKNNKLINERKEKLEELAKKHNLSWKIKEQYHF